MKTIEINKSFKTHQECTAWEKENLDRILKLAAARSKEA